MANTVFKLRRSSVAGKVPNTSTLAIGELGLNLTDQKIFSSDGSAVFELGANVTNQYVYTTLSVGNSSVNSVVNSTSLTVKSIIANGSVGTSSQVLTSNGTGIYWSSVNVASYAIFTTVVDLFTANGTQNTFGLSTNTTSNNSTVYINGVEQTPGNSYSISTNTIAFTFNPANGSTVEIKSPVISNISTSDITAVVGSNQISYSNGVLQTAVTANTVTTSQISVDTFSTGYRSAKYYIQVTDTSNNQYHSTNIDVMHDGVTVYVSEYGTIITGTSLASFDFDIQSSSVRCLITPTYAFNNIRIFKTVLAV